MVFFSLLKNVNNNFQKSYKWVWERGTWIFVWLKIKRRANDRVHFLTQASTNYVIHNVFQVFLIVFETL